jgi:hypothetical protein
MCAEHEAAVELLGRMAAACLDEAPAGGPDRYSDGRRPGTC